jgi:hypothetical protein
MCENSGGSPQFGLIPGLGIRSNAEKWAIRPEIGYGKFLLFKVS